jgi:signal transduction histidine kinase
MKGFLRRFWIGVVFLFILHDIFAQSAEITRLKTSLGHQLGRKQFRPDTPFVDTLNALAHAFYGINADSAFFHCRKALDIAIQIGYPKGQSEAWRMLGNTYELVGDYPDMMSSYQRSLTIADSLGQANLIARAHVNMAMFYKQAGEYDEAQQLMEKVEALYRQNGDSIQLAFVASHLSELALRQHRYDDAFTYSSQALRIAERRNDQPFVASINNDLGKILASKGDYPGSIRYYQRSLTYYRGLGERLGIATTCTLLARSLLMEKKYDEALLLAQQGFSLADELHRPKERLESAKVLADIYEGEGDDRSALYYFKIYKSYSDSLNNDQALRKTVALGTRFEYERQEALLRAEEARKDALHQRSLRRNTIFIFIAILVIFILTVLVSVFYRGRKDNLRTTRILQGKNREIEEQKEAIEQQKEAIEHQAVQLLLNNQEKDKLFSIIAHDLRGPLNSLKGLMDFLNQKKLPDAEIHHMLNEFRQNVDYSSELVSNLLFWASSQLNGIVVVPVILPMHALASAVSNLFTKQIEDKEIKLINELDPGLVGYGDEDMIQVVVRNLLSNAIKFCSQGDEIHVTGRNSGGHIEICVADTGTGIQSDVLEKIRKNVSVTTYGTAKEKGTGIGMLLCREFIELNNGEFWVESEWGEGSRFYFTIPEPPSSSSISV